MLKKEIMTTFYNSFMAGDYKSMNNLYHKNVVFNDEIFKNLNYEYVTNMWKMLISNKEDNEMEISFEVKEEKNDLYVVWTAKYLFGRKKRKVINVVKSNMEIQDNKIIGHTDSFNFKKWAKQAIGGLGGLFANKKSVRDKISKKAMEKISNYINQ